MLLGSNGNHQTCYTMVGMDKPGKGNSLGILHEHLETSPGVAGVSESGGYTDYCTAMSKLIIKVSPPNSKPFP